MRGLLRGLSLGVALVLSTALMAAPGIDTRTLMVDGQERTYHLFVPRNLSRGGAPVVVAFHGGGGRALPFAKRVGLRQLAQQGGAVILLPEGLGAPGRRGGSWNAGGTLGFAARSDVDDLGFVKTMLADAARQVEINPGQVYATGLSQGGMMAYHAACSLEETFSAIAVVAGTLDAPGCRYGDDVSLLHIHGTADENVPLDGGRGALSAPAANWPDVARGLDLFRAANACEAGGAVDHPARDTTCRINRCSDGEAVELCLIDEGGHGWPGTEPAQWQKTNNVYVSPYFDATAHIAEFFFGQ